jgi:hypothetical protein
MEEISEVWVGKTEVSRSASCQFDPHIADVGAFVWWATQATDKLQFEQKVRKALTHYGLILLEIERIQPAKDLLNPSSDLSEAIERAETNADWTLYATFHTYKRHNA